MRCDVIAIGAVSALGRGREAFSAGRVGQPAQVCIARDAFFAEAGLTRPLFARAPLPHDPERDRAAELLDDALAQVAAQLDGVLPAWRERKIGVAMGTSSGGMLSAEALFRAHAAGPVGERLARRASYFAPLDEALSRARLSAALQAHVVAACASSTIALGLGMRWLARGGCELVLAGGYDAVSVFVAAGFESLRATCASAPRPFRVGRDGMALGEGAAVLALVPGRQAHCGSWAKALFSLAGFGASCDAVHITAPDRDGLGLMRAGTAALRDAGLPGAAIDLVSAHGTATPYNDAAEARAVAALCPNGPVVHPFKAQIGHTLGAAGALELCAAADALARQIGPAAAGDGDLDSDARVRLLSRGQDMPMRAALKLSAAFGGVTAALALVPAGAADPSAPRPLRGATAIAWAAVEDVDRESVAASLAMPLDRLGRIDDLGQLQLAALAALRDRVGSEPLAGAGIVSGLALATIDTNARFYQRIAEKGPRWCDPRLFPATSPNSGAGHCAIALDLRGPNFCVSGGANAAIEALLAAAELIAARDAERMVVIAADDEGPLARRWLDLCAPGRAHRRGAVAVLLAPEGGGRAIDLDARPRDDGAIGHLALLDWLRRA